MCSAIQKPKHRYTHCMCLAENRYCFANSQPPLTFERFSVFHSSLFECQFVNFHQHIIFDHLTCPILTVNAIVWRSTPVVHFVADSNVNNP